MTPPLDASAPSADRSVPTRIVTPTSLLDLRADHVDELRYPATAVLIFAGVPGAGKSTALHRLFGADPNAEVAVRATSGALVLDSNHARNRLRHRLGRVPYPLWRPLVHWAHYRAIRAALLIADGPVAIHDCATFAWSRRLIARWARAGTREVHMVLIDVPAAQARRGQVVRGRQVNTVAFGAHCRRWERLMRDLGARDAEPRTPLPATSLVIVDRPTLSAISRIAFTSSA
ncbi:AAA family ATPase [Nocardia caishijiensis]|uniref:AAA domain-containing protein n=1 Tax=Nocardia caishijiensis TaxID=184756 RepID=A0ABQ6YJA3_9NOCA|nr:AAA family ATPase [Nocardia caishijiensis]KAF0845880.1 AAA domain-containing protein [Nocardia caishijiensis]